ncbi:hypothetical protein PACTADRAFT_33844 [Pachysolen tannophilus NRRL Y-2460]|uniref:LIM zinc-binding domain-containing protein n=1 Tax=Pachysolen tannophilus NRRL Y-2460 TaxID=669874 RepID=A0A1E4TU44_PACTA|nr:hypothetical protein PACTADRAFT_33844 [Pachysolen tannophilus NRRL Y-2460]
MFEKTKLQARKGDSGVPQSPTMDSLPRFIRNNPSFRFNSPFPPLHPDKKYRGVYERAGFEVYKGDYKNHSHSHDIDHPSQCNSMFAKSAKNSPSPNEAKRFPRGTDDKIKKGDTQYAVSSSQSNPDIASLNHSQPSLYKETRNFSDVGIIASNSSIKTQNNNTHLRTPTESDFEEKSSNEKSSYPSPKVQGLISPKSQEKFTIPEAADNTDSSDFIFQNSNLTNQNLNLKIEENGFLGPGKRKNLDTASYTSSIAEFDKKFELNNNKPDGPLVTSIIAQPVDSDIDSNIDHETDPDHDTDHDVDVDVESDIPVGAPHQRENNSFQIPVINVPKISVNHTGDNSSDNPEDFYGPIQDNSFEPSSIYGNVNNNSVYMNRDKTYEALTGTKAQQTPKLAYHVFVNDSPQYSVNDNNNNNNNNNINNINNSNNNNKNLTIEEFRSRVYSDLTGGEEDEYFDEKNGYNNTTTPDTTTTTSTKSPVKSAEQNLKYDDNFTAPSVSERLADADKAISEKFVHHKILPNNIDLEEQTKPLFFSGKTSSASPKSLDNPQLNFSKQAKAININLSGNSTPMDSPRSDFFQSTNVHVPPNSKLNEQESQSQQCQHAQQQQAQQQLQQHQQTQQVISNEKPDIKYPAGKGPCRRCGLNIIGKSIWSKDGQLSGRWHRDCFSCHNCAMVFDKGSNCYVIQDHPYCEQHFHELNDSLCHICTKGIEGQCLENENKEKFHPGCLTCHKCGEFITRDYFIVDQMPLCERDGLMEIQFERERALHFAGGGLDVSKIEKRRTRLLQI